MTTSKRIAAAILIALMAAGCATAKPSAPKTPETFTFTPGPVAPLVSLDDTRKGWAEAQARLDPPRVPVKGIYLTSYSAGNPAKLKELMDLVDRTELNAMVINVKDDWGDITFDWDHPIATGSGAVHSDLGNLKELTAKLKAKGIYSIARIVTFKDAWVPKAHPELAIHSTAGGIWKDYNGVTWLNPYSKAAWDYVVDIGKAAALGGFDEIQYDYVRFPTDGNLDAIVYPGKDSRPKQQVIADFLGYARKELRPYGVWVSADVFGLVTSMGDDMGIGQHLEELSHSLDYVSPMVYPSHYIPGNMGVANPNAMPYDTVHHAMLDAKGRLEKEGTADQMAVRPWLQDFSMGYPYGAKEVRAQIQATYDAGYNQWLLWNAANEYTEAALQPKQAGKQ